MSGTQNARMAAAPAKVFIEGRTDLCIRGVVILSEQLGNQHDHATRTVSALRRLFVEKGTLYGM
jgi:hypothetical protein